MTPRAQSILQHLEAVAAERARRAQDGSLVVRTAAVKAYQQRRFAMTYADLLRSPRYGPASSFFLEELYGPKDFTERDAQFSRVVPAMVRLFPSELVDTVDELASLHALTERMDTALAESLPNMPVDASAYVAAWRRTGGVAERESQIALTLAIGSSIDRLTRKPLLRRALHVMRGPARAAGLGALQGFLETGFDTFKSMNGAQEFLATVGSRERALCALLFDPTVDPAKSGQLP